jgi:ubiquinone/menaquinone biosynthesis C-methylase UbiE
MAEQHAAFVGNVPGNYDRYLGPLLFHAYADDLAARLPVFPGVRVLEVACGTGIVTRRPLRRLAGQGTLVATDLNQAMLDWAATRLPSDPRLTLRAADAQALPFADASFDTVAFSFSLCTITEPEVAVAEAVRVLRPIGRLVALEHVRSPITIVRIVERLVEPLTIRSSGDHLLREPVDLVTAQGLEIVSVERFRLGVFERLVATKPGS